MTELLFDHLRLIRDSALAAVDPAAAVRRAMSLSGDHLLIGSTTWDLAGVERVLLVAAGKAAPAMAGEAAAVLGGRLSAGVVVARHGQAPERLPPAIEFHAAGHPVPDEAGLDAARRVRMLLAGATARDRVIALISGGASALLPLPVEGVSLADLQAVTTLLLRSGASISELNAVRKHLDQLKGGQMARLAAPAPLAALVLSDVVGDRLDVIASGPVVADESTYANALAVLSRYGLLEQTPAAVLAQLRAGAAGRLAETPKPGDPALAGAINLIVGSNRMAAQAAADKARQLGYHSLLLTTFVEGEAHAAGAWLAALAKGVRAHGDPLRAPACLVLGGETTVSVRGAGRGGRNQEVAVAAALALDGLPGAAVMALATDGSDGPTDAGGALVSGETAARARALGVDLAAALRENDTYPALDRLGALIKTGQTGTNVNDLYVMLVGEG